MIRRAVALVLLGATPATAQVVSSLKPADLSSYATTAAVNAAIAAATPAPCPAPLPDTLFGTTGTGICMARPDSTRPAVVQATTTSTASDGTFSGTWPAPFAASPTAYLADISMGASPVTPYKCTVQSVTATAYSGRCWQLVATTLPATTTALLGLVVSPVSNATAGLSVRVVGRQ